MRFEHKLGSGCLRARRSPVRMTQALRLCVRVEVMRRSRNPDLLKGVPLTWGRVNFRGKDM